LPVVRFADDGPLAQSNAIILHLAQNSDLIPADPFEARLDVSVAVLGAIQP